MIKNSKSVKESTVKKNLPVTLNKQCVSLFLEFLSGALKKNVQTFLCVVMCMCVFPEWIIHSAVFFFLLLIEMQMRTTRRYMFFHYIWGWGYFHGTKNHLSFLLYEFSVHIIFLFAFFLLSCWHYIYELLIYREINLVIYYSFPQVCRLSLEFAYCSLS